MGVMISAGAACSNGLHEPSHVIMAMFHDEARARSAVRISMSHTNTEEQTKLASVKIAEAVAYLRSLN
jgi:cysteine desulfurase